MEAIDIREFREEISTAWKLYINARIEFIEALSFNQYRTYNKLLRKLTRQRNIIKYAEIDISKVSKNSKIVAKFNDMSKLYNDYVYLSNRSELKLL